MSTSIHPYVEHFDGKRWCAKRMVGASRHDPFGAKVDSNYVLYLMLATCRRPIAEYDPEIPAERMTFLSGGNDFAPLKDGSGWIAVVYPVVAERGLPIGVSSLVRRRFLSDYHHNPTWLTIGELEQVQARWRALPMIEHLQRYFDSSTAALAFYIASIEAGWYEPEWIKGHVPHDFRMGGDRVPPRYLVLLERWLKTRPDAPLLAQTMDFMRSLDRDPSRVRLVVYFDN